MRTRVFFFSAASAKQKGTGLPKSWRSETAVINQASQNRTGKMRIICSIMSELVTMPDRLQIKALVELLAKGKKVVRLFLNKGESYMCSH